jgi:hypothetical protein
MLRDTVSPRAATGTGREKGLGGMMNSVLRISLATLVLVASPGCSLILTKGPQTEMRPAPECTTSVAAPVVDTALATASFALSGFGVWNASASSRPTCGAASYPPSSFCTLGVVGWETAVWAVVVVGAGLGALFVTSAVIGYNRTSACRALLPPPGPLVPATAPLPKSPAGTCAPIGDAPRICTKAVFMPGGG